VRTTREGVLTSTAFSNEEIVFTAMVLLTTLVVTPSYSNTI